MSPRALSSEHSGAEVAGEDCGTQGHRDIRGAAHALTHRTVLKMKGDPPCFLTTS